MRKKEKEDQSVKSLRVPNGEKGQLHRPQKNHGKTDRKKQARKGKKAPTVSRRKRHQREDEERKKDIRDPQMAACSHGCTPDPLKSETPKGKGNPQSNENGASGDP